MIMASALYLMQFIGKTIKGTINVINGRDFNNVHISWKADIIELNAFFSTYEHDFSWQQWNKAFETRYACGKLENRAFWSENSSIVGCIDLKFNYKYSRLQLWDTHSYETLSFLQLLVYFSITLYSQCFCDFWKEKF